LDLGRAMVDRTPDTVIGHAKFERDGVNRSVLDLVKDAELTANLCCVRRPSVSSG
jgi:hypothetical protein